VSKDDGQPSAAYLDHLHAELQSVAPGKVARMKPDGDGAVEVDGDLRPVVTAVEEAAMRALFGIPPSYPLSPQELEALRRHPNDQVRRFFEKFPNPRT
jgi:hypothetical protein